MRNLSEHPGANRRKYPLRFDFTKVRVCRLLEFIVRSYFVAGNNETIDVRFFYFPLLRLPLISPQSAFRDFVVIQIFLL